MTNLTPVVSKDTPESVKRTLRHWHMYKGDKFLAWKDGKFGRWFREEDGSVNFDSNIYSGRVIGELTTFEAEEANIIEMEEAAKKKLAEKRKGL